MKNIHATPLFFVSILILSFASSCGKQTQETTPITKKVSVSVFASGVLAADEQYTLIAQSSGYITALNFDEGDLVNKGDILLEIKDDDSQINLSGADKQLAIAQQNASKNAPLLLQKVTYAIHLPL